MEYLLIHPKRKEMLVSDGLSDILFAHGWRTGCIDRRISEETINEHEHHGYEFIDETQALNNKETTVFHIQGRKHYHYTLHDMSEPNAPYFRR